MIEAENNAGEARLIVNTPFLNVPERGPEVRPTINSFADVEAARRAGHWSIAELTRAADVTERYYHMMRCGQRPITDGALSRLINGLRILERRNAHSTTSLADPRIIEMGDEYATIAKGMQRRRMELGLTVEQVDYLTGFASGHTAKLEAWDTPTGRGFGEVSCKLWCEALGVYLAVIEGVVPTATRRMINPIGPAELAKRYDANRKRADAKRRTMEAKRAGRTA